MTKNNFQINELWIKFLILFSFPFKREGRRDFKKIITI